MMYISRDLSMSPPTNSVEFTTGKRGKDNVIYDGQRYNTLNRSLHGTDGVEKSRGCGLRWQTLRPTLPADMDPFIQYFETTWMGTPNRPALFEPSCWNQYDVCLAGLPRSSNLADVLLFTFYHIIYSTSRLKI